VVALARTVTLMGVDAEFTRFPRIA
jgi:hypothetical protein